MLLLTGNVLLASDKDGQLTPVDSLKILPLKLVAYIIPFVMSACGRLFVYVETGSLLVPLKLMHKNEEIRINDVEYLSVRPQSWCHQ